MSAVAGAQQIPGGLMSLPFPVFVLLSAPVVAILAGFFIFRPRRPQWTHWPILASCAAVAASAVWIAAEVFGRGWGIDLPLAEWMWAGGWSVSFGVRIDGLSAAVLTMVALVGGLIHLYAAAYMRQDPSFSRFFLYFHFFFFAMIGLLVSNNFVQLYLFWELVGLASYLLIGFWHHKKTARDAALQAFMTNRVGDFGLLLAVLLIMVVFKGHTRFAMVLPLIQAVDPALVSLIGLLLFWAASAKSAQFPLHFWLPDAMEGPTPVSALMHAATMVTAGIFLLARAWPLIAAASGLPELIAAIGALTALGAAAIASTKRDLKRILAYSTVSHLGIMAFALGLGQVRVAVLHLIMHGFFKASLFLCAGNIAHALHRPTVSIDEVGGLARKMPITFACFLLSALSLAGIWPAAGFFSKDAMLDAALHRGGWAAGAGLLISFGSAFYITRMLSLAFLGPRRHQAGAHHAHEAEPALAVPLVFLSFGALAAGWVSGPLAQAMISGWPSRVLPAALPVFSMKVAALGMGAAALGAGVAFFLSLARPDWDWNWRAAHPRIERVFESDFGWKAVVGLLVSLMRWVSGRAVRWVDTRVLDRVVEDSPILAEKAGGAARAAATGSLNDALWWMIAAAAGLIALGALR